MTKLYSTLLFLSLFAYAGKNRRNHNFLYYIVSGCNCDTGLAPACPPVPNSCFLTSCSPGPSSCQTIGAIPKAACIDGENRVLTPEGHKRIDQLSIGDWVASGKNEKGYVFEQIVSFIHRDKSKEAAGFRFTTSGGRQMSLSAEHLLLLAPYRRAVLAKDVKVGQEVFTSTGWQDKYKKELIVKIDPEVLTGLYSPLTKSGTLLVNDILVSCYSHTNDEKLMHFMIHWIMSLVGYDKAFEPDGMFGREDGLHSLVSPLWHFFRWAFVAPNEAAKTDLLGKEVTLQAPPMRPTKLDQPASRKWKLE